MAVAVFDAESVTFTAKLAAPATGVAPESTPEFDRLRPTAVRLPAPDVTDQVYPVPDPPVAASVCAYATPPYPTGSALAVVIVSVGYTTTI